MIASVICERARIEDYSKVSNIATDEVYTEVSVEIKQMILLLRLLANHIYAKVTEQHGEQRFEDAKPAEKGVAGAKADGASVGDESKASLRGMFEKFWSRINLWK